MEDRARERKTESERDRKRERERLRIEMLTRIISLIIVIHFFVGVSVRVSGCDIYTNRSIFWGGEGLVTLFE